jgi:hypothetical protein
MRSHLIRSAISAAAAVAALGVGAAPALAKNWDAAALKGCHISTSSDGHTLTASCPVHNPFAIKHYWVWYTACDAHHCQDLETPRGTAGHSVTVHSGAWISYVKNMWGTST